MSETPLITKLISKRRTSASNKGATFYHVQRYMQVMLIQYTFVRHFELFMIQHPLPDPSRAVGGEPRRNGRPPVSD
jgi:hypothetical protein